MQILLLVHWYYSRERESRYNVFQTILRLGVFDLNNCFPKEMVLYGSIVIVIPSKIIFISSLNEKSVDIGRDPPWTALLISVARDLSLPRC